MKEESEKAGLKLHIQKTSIRSHHFVANRWRKVETVTDFTFLGSKITVDGDLRHEVKGHLLLERKVMINVDSILKSRDITLSTMAPHSSTLAWKIPWTEEPGGLQSMGSLRVGHD